MDEVLPTIPVNTSIDSKLVLTLDSEFASATNGDDNILNQGNVYTGTIRRPDYNWHILKLFSYKCIYVSIYFFFAF